MKRQVIPRTIEGLETWLKKQPYEVKRTFRARADVADRSLYLIQLKELWLHVVRGQPLHISTIETLPETPESRRERLDEQARLAAIDGLPTWKRAKILQYKSPDTGRRRPKTGSSKLPWPWPR